MTDYPLETVIMLLPVILPVVFWGAYHLHADRHLPEPPSHLLVAFGLGTGAFWLGARGYEALEFLHLRQDAFALAQTSLPGLFVYSLGIIGVIEEGAKMLPFLLVVIHFREFDEPIDGIIYASFIALGFAAVENLHYLEYLSGTEAYARGFAGPVIHIVFASVWGYFIGKAVLSGRRLFRTILAMLILTAALHGLYDFIVIGLPPAALPFSAALIAAIWIWRLRLIRDLHTASANRLEN
ncbi:PrsW family intramembrane metalloprotease [Elongatibacter sediminis]|uniref:PrsW family intramembrane metalloprotease n=1 Tax=Elongatibacter sediminis TaxID=3119006 RepID=A0AAW9R693_9GAMM